MSVVSDLITQYAKLNGHELPSGQVRLLEVELVERLKLTLDDIRAACMSVAYSGKEMSLRNILFSIPGAWPEPAETLGMLWHSMRIPSLAVHALKPFGAQFEKYIGEAFMISYERLVVHAWLNGEVRAQWIGRDVFFEEIERKSEVLK
jgi:hypothetical protein